MDSKVAVSQEAASGHQQPGLHEEQNHQQGGDPRWEPALLSLVSAEDMAGKSGFSSMFSSTTETWTSRRKFSEGTGASFVQEEGERTSSVQPREVQARESSTDVWK